MTPEAERFNGWAAMLGFVASSRDIRNNRTNHTILMYPSMKEVEKENYLQKNLTVD